MKGAHFLIILLLFLLLTITIGYTVGRSVLAFFGKESWITLTALQYIVVHGDSYGEASDIPYP
jgi:hypothetical protein